MQKQITPSAGLRSLIVIREQPPDKYIAQVVGIPEIQSTAPSRDQAIQEVQILLKQWHETGRLVLVEAAADPLLIRDPGDPLEKEFLQDIARSRREDLERTLQEYEAECSNSSSTPTT
jgi:predicted RNase H-like HicB family nuclease